MTNFTSIPVADSFNLILHSQIIFVDPLEELQNA